MSSYNIRAPNISPLTTNQLTKTKSAANTVTYYLTFNKSLPSVTNSSLTIKTYPDLSGPNKPLITGEFVTETEIKINIDYSAANSDDGKP